MTLGVMAEEDLEAGRVSVPSAPENFVPILVGLDCGTASPEDHVGQGIDARMLVKMQTTGKWYIKLGPGATFRVSTSLSCGHLRQTIVRGTLR
jgi:hypothetical protein